jgi:uncharacterized protein YbaR (Trm112 family)
MGLLGRDFFTEKTEARPMSLACPACRHRGEYRIRWVRRTRRAALPERASEADRARFAKLRDHLFRVDDFVNCPRCRRRFEIPSHQSMVFP